MKLDEKSGSSIPNNINYFETELTNVAIDKTYEREFITLNPINEAPHQFIVLSGASYIDPSKTRVVTTWNLKKREKGKTEWVNVVAEDNVNVVNGLGAAFPKNLKIMANGMQMFNSNNFYSYLAHFMHELRYAEDAKKSSMNAFGYYYENEVKDYEVKDADAVGTAGTSGYKPAVVAKYNKTEAWKERRDLFTDGKFAEFSAPLYADIFMQPMLLPSNMELDFEFIPQQSNFLIVAPTIDTTKWDVSLKMHSIRLFVTFVDLHPNVALEIEKRLATEPMKISVKRTELRNLIFDQQRLENHSTAFTDFVPREMDLAFIPRDNFVGTVNTDPFYCDHANLSELQATATTNNVPFVPFIMDFDKNRYVRAFEHLHRTIGLSENAIDCGINRKMFGKGYTIFPFKLTPSQEDHGGFDFIQQGPTTFKTKHKKEIPFGGMYVVLVGFFDSIMYIDLSRTIRTDLNM